MTRLLVVVPGTGNKNLPTMNIVTSAHATADNYTAISSGTNEHKKVQAAVSTVKGLKTLCVPNYSTGYTAKAVHFAPGGSFGTMFDGALVPTGNFNCALFSVWVANLPVSDPDVFVYISDDINAGFNLNQNAASDFSVIAYDDPGGNRSLSALDSGFLLPITTWTHVIVSAKKSTQTLQCYVNGSPLAFAEQIDWTGTGTGFGNSSGDTWSILAAAAEFDTADLYFNLSNTFFDLSIPANLAKFISGGKPVDPSGFPSGILLLSGTAAQWASQAAAYGLTPAGTLTNASTSPSG